MIKILNNTFFKPFLLISVFFLLINCGLYKKTDPKTPVSGEERARINIKQGKGLSLKNFGKGGATNFEFSSSNPMWRASLELLDFLPLTTVNYSGGIIITDWYSENNSNESLKITVRFLSNEIRSNSLKIIVHQKNCSGLNQCNIKELNSSIKRELAKSILNKAAQLEREQINKKK